MKKVLKFLERLSRDEMRTVSGGYEGDGPYAGFCQCNCCSFTSAWTGTYGSYDQVVNALDNYCGGSGGSGGQCFCNGG